MFSLSYVSKKFLSVLLLISLFLSACKSNNKDKLDENLLSSGTQSSKELNDERDNIDKKSYAGLEDVFLDNKSISPNDKYMLLVLGVMVAPIVKGLKKISKMSKNCTTILKSILALTMSISAILKSIILKSAIRIKMMKKKSKCPPKN